MESGFFIENIRLTLTNIFHSIAGIWSKDETYASTWYYENSYKIIMQINAQIMPFQKDISVCTLTTSNPKYWVPPIKMEAQDRSVQYSSSAMLRKVWFAYLLLNYFILVRIQFRFCIRLSNKFWKLLNERDLNGPCSKPWLVITSELSSTDDKKLSATLSDFNWRRKLSIL